VYLAGPEMFLPWSQALALAERKKAMCAGLGLEGVFPFDLEATVANGSTSGPARACAIADKDETVSTVAPWVEMKRFAGATLGVLLIGTNTDGIRAGRFVKAATT